MKQSKNCLKYACVLMVLFLCFVLLIQSLIHRLSVSQMNSAVQMQPGQVPPNQNFLNRPPGPITVTHGNVQQQVKQQCFPLSSLPCPALSRSSALCTHPASISPRLEIECACCSKPSWSPPLCPSLSASVCGGGLALRQSGHTDGGPAETEQHGENQKHNWCMHARTQVGPCFLQAQGFTTWFSAVSPSCEQRSVLKGTLLKEVSYAHQGYIY